MLERQLHGHDGNWSDIVYALSGRKVWGFDAGDILHRLHGRELRRRDRQRRIKRLHLLLERQLHGHDGNWSDIVYALSGRKVWGFDAGDSMRRLYGGNLCAWDGKRRIKRLHCVRGGKVLCSRSVKL